MKNISIEQGIKDFLLTINKYGAYNAKDAESVLNLIFDENLITPSTVINGSEEDIRSSIIRGICKRKRKSGKESKIANDFFHYLSDLKKHPAYSYEIAKLPPQLSPLERQLALAKGLHGEKKEDGGIKVTFRDADVAEEFLVSDTTIQNDLSQLREGIGVMDQRFQIDFEKKNGSISMISSVHPLFLTPNLTQIVIILEGLRTQSQELFYRNYANNMAIGIWKQLSDYARDRILNDLPSILNLDAAWYAELDRMACDSRDSLFLDEMSSARSNDAYCTLRNEIIFCIKDGRRCDITFADDSNNVTSLASAKIVHIDNKLLEVIHNQNEYKIDINKIIEFFPNL